MGSGRGGAGPAKVAGGTWGFGSAAGYQKLQTEVLYHFHSVSAPGHPRDCQCCLEAQGLTSLPHGVPNPTGFWGSEPHGEGVVLISSLEAGMGPPTETEHTHGPCLSKREGSRSAWTLMNRLGLMPPFP